MARDRLGVVAARCGRRLCALAAIVLLTVGSAKAAGSPAAGFVVASGVVLAAAIGLVIGLVESPQLWRRHH